MDIARFKNRKKKTFYIILLDPIPTCFVCNFQSVSSANWQLESFITMTHQLLLSKKCQLTICRCAFTLTHSECSLLIVAVSMHTFCDKHYLHLVLITWFLTADVVKDSQMFFVAEEETDSSLTDLKQYSQLREQSCTCQP